MSRLTDAPLASTRGGSGEPLVLIHGLGSSRTIWDRTRPPLERRFDVIAVDLPGFGDQPWFSGDVPETMDSLASAVEEELDRLGLDRPRLVGHSMGGWIALELARRGSAREVIAISPVGGATAAEARASNRVLKATRIAARLARPGVGLLLRARPLRWVGFRGAAGHPGDVSYEDATNAARYMASSTGFPKLIDEVAGGGDLFERNESGFGQIACPVLIACGTEDRVLSSRGGTRLAEAIPRAELRVLAGEGHSPMLDRPELVSALILERFG